MAKVKERPQEELYTEERGLDGLLRRVNPLNDVLFKYLFASKDNKENLLRLLNDTLYQIVSKGQERPPCKGGCPEGAGGC